eukprot:Opistho-2@832
MHTLEFGLQYHAAAPLSYGGRCVLKRKADEVLSMGDEERAVKRLSSHDNEFRTMNNPIDATMEMHVDGVEQEPHHYNNLSAIHMGSAAPSMYASSDGLRINGESQMQYGSMSSVTTTAAAIPTANGVQSGFIAEEDAYSSAHGYRRAMQNPTMYESNPEEMDEAALYAMCDQHMAGARGDLDMFPGAWRRHCNGQY